MKIAIGSDHHGVALRTKLRAGMEKLGHEVVDLGADAEASVDYPDIAAAVALQVSAGEVNRGVLICASGIGMSIAANKVDGILAAACRDPHTAEMSRRHNDANVLCLSDVEVTTEANMAIVAKWLETDFEGGRHQRRVDKIRDLE